MSVFPLKFRNSAFWKAFILYKMKTFPYCENTLSLTFDEISPLNHPSWWKAARIKATFRAGEFLDVTAGVEFAGGTCGVVFGQVSPFVSTPLTHLLNGNSTGYSVHPQEAQRLG